ncbi:MAG: hypothetical protein IPP12_00290 [Nitrospira sp.]|nr:hypothetical protein [Nitrospira sp.]
MGKDKDSVEPLTAQKSHDDVIRASDGGFMAWPGTLAYWNHADDALHSLFHSRIGRRILTLFVLVH